MFTGHEAALTCTRAAHSAHVLIGADQHCNDGEGYQRIVIIRER